MSYVVYRSSLYLCFFFNDTATTEIYTLSLHDALPILRQEQHEQQQRSDREARLDAHDQHEDEGNSPREAAPRDRKSTRLNSSHGYISYAVFCLKKKKQTKLTSTLLKHIKLRDTHVHHT